MIADTTDLLASLGVEIDPDLLSLALMHRSFAYENGALPTNERLEFLGDSVLGIVITDTLYRRYPDCTEGQLAKLRAAVVNATALADVARTIGLGQFLYLGRGEETTGGRDKSSILADTMEAVFGAVYLTSGIGTSAEVIHRLFDPLIERAAELGAGLDWKTSLQEIAAAADLGLPEYHVTDVGPDHAKEFSARAVVGGEVLGEGTGRSKKVAEQQAAAAAYEAIRSARAVADPAVE
ncbi:MAG: ribonuclease III [Actinobacteria bacterium]|nr:ribonuclease III [Actinomycetota bacterium]